MTEKNNTITDLLKRAKEVASWPAGVRSTEIGRKGIAQPGNEGYGYNLLQTATDFQLKQLL